MKIESSLAALDAALERDRASLLSGPEGTAHRGPGGVSSALQGYVGGVDRAIRANPIAVSMVAGGLAWLVVGSGGRRAGPQQPSPPTLSRWEGEGGSVDLPRATTKASDDAEWFRLLDGQREDARDRIVALEDVGSASDGAGTRQNRQARILADLESSMSTGLGHGLEGLSDKARDRIVLARKTAYVAVRAGKADLRRSGQSAAERGELPVLAGAIALAITAGLVAMIGMRPDPSRPAKAGCKS